VDDHAPGLDPDSLDDPGHPPGQGAGSLTQETPEQGHRHSLAPDRRAVGPELGPPLVDEDLTGGGDPQGVLPEGAEDRPIPPDPQALPQKLSDRRRPSQVQLTGVEPDADRPDRQIPDGHMPGQEGVEVRGRERQRVVAGAKPAFPQEKLGQNALESVPGCRIGRRDGGLGRPGQHPCGNRGGAGRKSHH
jgi:hypothetical protein